MPTPTNNTSAGTPKRCPSLVLTMATMASDAAMTIAISIRLNATGTA